MGTGTYRSHQQFKATQPRCSSACYMYGQLPAIRNLYSSQRRDTFLGGPLAPLTLLRRSLCGGASRHNQHYFRFLPHSALQRKISSTIEAPASQPADTTTYTSIGPRSNRVLKRDAGPTDDLHLDTVIQGSISLNCKRLTVGETAKATADVVAARSSSTENSVGISTRPTGSRSRNTAR